MNIPNMLTISRIVMIAVAVVISAFCEPKIQDITKNVEILRLIVITLAFFAGLTDLLDGYLARKWNQITDFGALMDPLADKIFVTRQTISNWELNETSPNTEQLKLLSKSFNISIDDLLDNEIKTVLVEKISNTEKLAGIVIKILKVLGIAFAALFTIDVIALIVFILIRTVA